MLPYLVFDLETIPDAQGLRQLHDYPAEASDQEVVASAQEAQLAKTGSDFLPLHLQKIIAIACVFRDQHGFRVKSLGEPDASESRLIQQFFKTVDHYTPILVSWNGSGFDLPVLHYRSLIHGVCCMRYWDQGEDDRDFRYNNYLNRYHQRHIDLMDLLAKFNARANASLDQLAKLCGFPGKLGMDGSQVWHAYQEGQLQAIRDYCETDVVNTWLMHCRFLLIKGALTEQAYQQEIDLVKSHLQQLSESRPEPWQTYLNQWSSAAN
ncbi:3'-5' exonuclease [Brackiella oedipodis]|uniref:3'-5' exonuclease n=1 Tax=Brackiella oedipodis TaxID=124225 RepID=UPI0004911BBB|nr:3'-5' exonuclease [Brackiella oedipodis]